MAASASEILIPFALPGNAKEEIAASGWCPPRDDMLLNCRAAGSISGGA